MENFWVVIATIVVTNIAATGLSLSWKLQSIADSLEVIAKHMEESKK